MKTWLLLWVILFFSINTLNARELSLGLAASHGVENYTKEAKRLGLESHALMYWDVSKNMQDLPYKGYPQKVNIVVALKFENQTENVIDMILDKKFDANIIEFAQKIKENGRAISIRPMYELNGNWYPWQIYYKDNTPEKTIAAFRHVVDLFRANAPDLITVDLNLNRKSAKGKNTSDFEDIYPGDQYVDRITLSNYNRCGTNSSAQKIEVFADYFGPAYDKLSTISQRPIGVAEAASTKLCGINRLQWYQDMLDSFVTRFPRVDHVTFFFETIPAGLASNTIPIQWGLDKSEERSFKKMIINFKKTHPQIFSKEQVLQAKKESEKESDSESSFSIMELLGYPELPWSIYGRGEYFFSSTFNDAENPITHELFGVIDYRLRLHLSQSLKWKINSQYSFSLKGTLGAVVSNNGAQWWNNQSFIRTEARICKKSSGLWGENCFFGGISYIEYFSDLPERYGKGILGQGKETQVYVGIELSFGGDLSR